MNDFFMYDTNYIAGVMDLRKPQKKSLEILDEIFTKIKPNKNTDLASALTEINKIYPTCSNFERDFLSLSFVLATGVGKTRLMGAFITYLYTQHNIKNFFIVAPNSTIYNKLKKDFTDRTSEKYIFNGLGCFAVKLPQIISDDDYRTKPLSLFDQDVKIFIYNIDKFNKENANMKKINEMLGDSFYEHLSKLDDLVIIMDEAHHYHADKGAKALDELNPILGLELTATPFYNIGSKQEKFKNCVYEYPLSESIRDGYTRTPFALTQKDVNFYNFGEDDLDKVMIQDGIKSHENIKQELEIYSANYSKKKVKPFMMIVCKDTDHASKIYDYVCSSNFKNGEYKNKTLLIHSNQKKADREKNVELLLGLEKYDNPIEIVIHVDMLKEGWDVNNLYTIVPLRTASSKILREQMVGRGLRLPFGKRTGLSHIDAVMLTAHGKFEDILEEAKKGDSIFNAKNVIYAENIEKQEQYLTQLSFPDDKLAEELKKSYEESQLVECQENENFLLKTDEIIKEKINNEISKINNRKETIDKEKIKKEVFKKIEEDKDLKDIYNENSINLFTYIENKVSNYVAKTTDKFIPIPLITVTETGMEEYGFTDFDLDMDKLIYVPSENKLILQNLQDQSEREIMDGDYINVLENDPKKEILFELLKKSQIDYEKCSKLLFKLITQFTDFYEKKYSSEAMKNIIAMNKRSIAENICSQMFEEGHFYHKTSLFEEKIYDVSRNNRATTYQFKNKSKLFENFSGELKQNLFTDMKKSVFDSAKFDSLPELKFAKLLEHDEDTLKWLRPNPEEFNLHYDKNKRYEPDFVVETSNTIYLVEVKGEDKINNADVIAKKERAVEYCKIASTWAKSNGYKEWKYLFIPSQEIKENYSLAMLTEKFVVN